MKVITPLALAVVLLLTHSALGQSRLGLIEVGKPFPALKLPTLDGGKPVSLADFRGQKVVLHIFASW